MEESQYEGKDIKNERGDDWWSEVLDQSRHHGWQQVLTLKRRDSKSEAVQVDKLIQRKTHLFLDMGLKIKGTYSW